MFDSVTVGLNVVRGNAVQRHVHVLLEQLYLTPRFGRRTFDGTPWDEWLPHDIDRKWDFHCHKRLALPMLLLPAREDFNLLDRQNAFITDALANHGSVTRERSVFFSKYIGDGFHLYHRRFCRPPVDGASRDHRHA